MAVLEPVGDGCDGCERGTDGEGHDDDAVGVDAHEFGGVGVLAGGLHAAAGAGLGDEEAEGDHADGCGDEDEEVTALDVGAEDVECFALELGEGSVLRGVGVPLPDGLLECEGESDRGDQRGEPGGGAQGPVGEAFGCDADGDGAYDATDDHEWDDCEEVGAGRHPEVHGESSEASDHEDLAVGEVDELDDSVDHRVSDRDESVHRAEDESIGQLLRQFVHRRASVEWFGYGTARERS